MNKSTKGALAATCGAILLLGGAGSLAYWTDTEIVGGGAINGGTMTLGTDATNTGCGAWQLDSAEAAPLTYTAGDPLVPGDVLTRACSYTVTASGNHLRATVGVTSPNFSGVAGDFGGNLSATVSSLRVNGVVATEFTEANDGQSLTANVSVTWAGVDTGHQGVSTVLDDLTLTATQVHD